MKMPLPKNKKNHDLVMAERRKIVAERYLHGYSLQAIADEVKVSVVTVWKDMKALSQAWIEQSIESFDARKQIEIEKLNQLEMTAWQAWQKSCENAEFERKRKEFIRKEVEVKDAKGKIKKGFKLLPFKVHTETTSKGQTGDSKFLDIIQKCIETRLKVMGVYKDEKTIKAEFIQVNWSEMHTEEGKDPYPIEQDPVEQRIQQEINSPPVNSSPPGPIMQILTPDELPSETEELS